MTFSPGLDEGANGTGTGGEKNPRVTRVASRASLFPPAAAPDDAPPVALAPLAVVVVVVVVVV